MGQLPHGRNIPPWETLPCWAPTAALGRAGEEMSAGSLQGDYTHMYIWWHARGVRETLVFFPCL